MAWMRAQDGGLRDVSAVLVKKTKGAKPKITDGDGNKLAVYSKVGTMEAVKDDCERWLSGNGKSAYGGRNRVFVFPSEKEV